MTTTKTTTPDTKPAPDDHEPGYAREIKVMKRCGEALESLPMGGRQRVLAFLQSQFGRPDAGAEAG